MTVEVTVGRRRSRFVAIFLYTLRSCIPPKRWAAVLMPCAGALLFGLLARAVDDTRDVAFANVAAEGILSLMMPIAALIIGDAVLGAEVRGGTFHFTWLSPAPTWQIVLGRWLGGALVALVTIAPASAVAAVIAGSSSSAGPAFVAAAVGSVTYVALFIAIGCITQRTAVWSLAIVFLVERLLGAALDRHRSDLADVGIAGDLRRPARRPSFTPRAQRNSPGLGRRHPTRHRDRHLAGDRQLAPQAHQALRRQRLTRRTQAIDGSLISRAS